jgi:hypothetical protein
LISPFNWSPGTRGEVEDIELIAQLGRKRIQQDNRKRAAIPNQGLARVRIIAAEEHDKVALAGAVGVIDRQATRAADVTGVFPDLS